MNQTSRPLVQNLVKEAMENAAQRAQIASEGARQMNLGGDVPSSEKTASVAGAESVTTDYAMKLAAAIEFAGPTLVEMAKSANSAAVALSPGVSHSDVKGSPPGPGEQGHGHHTPPMHPSVQKGHPKEHAATQMENTIDTHVPGNQTTAMSGGKGKTAEALAASNLARLAKLASAPEEKSAPAQTKEASAPATTLVDHFLQTVKLAEDAINPAQISAGKEVPPDTSASGESGGAPLGGLPQGPTSLIASNEAARDYKKQQAHNPRKAELAQYFTEPALSAATDKTLHEAFAHTGEAGVKISSQQVVKTAAARALLMKLAEQGGIKTNDKKDPPSNADR